MKRGGRLSQESGLTMIEVVVTLFITVATVSVLAAYFVNASNSSLANTRQVDLLALAQKQIEAIRQQVKQSGFSTLGLSSLPAKAGADTDPSNPTDFVSSTGTSFEVEENYDAPGTLLATEPLITGGTIAPIQTNVSAGNATATVYTFVTQVTDVCNSLLSTAGSLCNGSATSSSNSDVRRVVVAVKLGAVNQLNGGVAQNPQYLTTVIANPVPSDQVNNATGLRIGLNVG